MQNNLFGEKKNWKYDIIIRCIFPKVSSLYIFYSTEIEDKFSQYDYTVFSST